MNEPVEEPDLETMQRTELYMWLTSRFGENNVACTSRAEENGALHYCYAINLSDLKLRYYRDDVTVENVLEELNKNTKETQPFRYYEKLGYVHHVIGVDYAEKDNDAMLETLSLIPPAKDKPLRYRPPGGEGGKGR